MCVKIINMNNNRTQDKIDLELSRTYFGNTSKPAQPLPEKTSPDEDKEKAEEVPPQKTVEGVEKKLKSRPARPRKKRSVLPALFIVVAIAAVGIYLYHGNFPAGTGSVIKDTPEKTINSPGGTFDRWNEFSAPPAEKFRENGKTLYDFEKNDNGWEIPSWALEKTDHIARTMKPVEGISSKGSGSLGVYAEFSGNKWSAALVEIQHYLDLTEYEMITADIFLPPDAPVGLRGKLILTIGDDWSFTEMTRTVRLKPGEWTTIKADIAEGNSSVWRRVTVDSAFKEDVRKIAVRIESNKPTYKGPIYIDNITVYPPKEKTGQ
ncbi:MAG: hypothetical protein GF409_03250 [Candidatus Omnitrophica bacterium]|nr:hypothetical protein [Candidatus Omnitrophota bacterium]